MRSLFANRDFRLLWAGQAVSTLGDAVTTLALLLTTQALTGSTAAVAITMIAIAAAVGFDAVFLTAGILVLLAAATTGWMFRGADLNVDRSVTTVGGEP